MNRVFLLDKRHSRTVANFFRDAGGIQVLAPSVLPVEAEDSPCRAELKILALARHLQGTRFIGPVGKKFPGLRRILEIKNPKLVLTVRWEFFRAIPIIDSDRPGEVYEEETGIRVKSWLDKGTRIYGYADERVFPEFAEVRIFVPVDALFLSEWMSEEKKKG